MDSSTAPRRVPINTNLGRRSFVRRAAGIGLGATAAALFGAVPLSVAMGTKRIPRIGFVMTSFSLYADLYEKFEIGLRASGLVDGHNITVEKRATQGRDDFIPGVVADLVELPVDLIVAGSSQVARVAAQMTSTIPIVMVTGTGVVESGLVSSIARPGGNITGLASHQAGMSAKRLQLLAEVVPDASRVAVLWHPTDPESQVHRRETEAAARALGVQLDWFEAQTGLPAAFERIGRSHAHALLPLTHPFLLRNRQPIVEFAAKEGLPAMHFWPEFTEGGGALGYGPKLGDYYTRAAHYVAKLVQGARPADLPIEYMNRITLSVNGDALHDLHLSLPSSVVVQVTEWIA